MGGNGLTLIDSRKLFVLSLLLIFHSFIYDSKKFYLSSVLLTSFLFSSILIIKVVSGEHSVYNDVQKFLLFLFSVLNLYILISSLISRFRPSVFFSFLILLAIFCPVLTIWNYYFISGAFLSTDTLLAILQTNAAETREYLQVNAGLRNYLLLGFAVLLLFGLSAYAAKIKRKTSKCLNILTALLILADVFTIYKYRENFLTDIFLKANEYTEKYRQFSESKEARMKIINSSLNVSSSDSDGVYVLVIGESQNKKHMSAYGYERPTTPWLDAMRSDSNFILFSSAYSCHAHTMQVLTYALTAKNQYNDLDLEYAPSLIEAAKAAGYDTAWLSNQVRYSAWDTPVTIIATEAAQQDWINKSVGENTQTDFYDEKLLDSLNKINLSGKMLIVIHLIGNHIAYNERYPENFSRYSGNTSIDKYDNSILYNDYVAQRIYEKAKTLPNFKALVYFADHADAVDQKLEHDANNFVPDMTFIPLYMYFSDEYIKEHPAVFANLKNMSGAYFTNDLIFNAVLGIMDIKLSDTYEKDNDITSPSYDADPGRFKTLYGKKSIKEGADI